MNDVIGLMAANQLFSLVAHKEASGNIIGMVADESLCEQEPNGDISAGDLLFQGGCHMVDIRQETQPIPAPRELCVFFFPSVPIQNNLERNGFQVRKMAFSAHQLMDLPEIGASCGHRFMEPGVISLPAGFHGAEGTHAEPFNEVEFQFGKSVGLEPKRTE